MAEREPTDGEPRRRRPATPPGSPGSPDSGQLSDERQQSPVEKVDAWLRSCHAEDAADAEVEPGDVPLDCGAPRLELPGTEEPADLEPLQRGPRALEGPDEPTPPQPEPVAVEDGPEPAAADGPVAEGAEGPDPAGAEGPEPAGAEGLAPPPVGEEAASSEASSSFALPDRMRRCASLKSGKTPPSTPNRRKIVRFADAMGLDLQEVHLFRDEIPTVPAAAFRELRNADRPPPGPVQMAFGSAPPAEPGPRLVPIFLQPGGSLDFLNRLRRDRVSLENVLCNAGDLTVSGIVRVLNMDFRKAVSVRFTVDDWRTSSEVAAEYMAGSCDGLSDRFRFTLSAAALAPGQRLQFAVQFRCLGDEFWDNNGGQNYAVELSGPKEGEGEEAGREGADREAGQERQDRDADQERQDRETEQERPDRVVGGCRPKERGRGP